MRYDVTIHHLHGTLPLLNLGSPSLQKLPQNSNFFFQIVHLQDKILP